MSDAFWFVMGMGMAWATAIVSYCWGRYIERSNRGKGESK